MELELFVRAQDGVYADVLSELRAGRKRGHWIWFIFPQARGLGLSEMSHRYGIESLEHARAYLAHPVLGARLRECTQLVMEARAPAEEALGGLDAMKLRSSLTLFALASDQGSLYSQALDRMFGGEQDARTLELVGMGQ